MPDSTILSQFNKGLHEIREAFHKTGRLDDSNAKLDEVAKLLSIEIAAAFEPKSGIPSLSSLVSARGGHADVVRSINAALAKVSRLDIYRNSDGDSLLGSNPRLSLAESEGDLAVKLGRLVSETFSSHLKAPENSKTFEAVNEAFGHFVRDNFRNNIEDAQYMTPPEVVDFVCELAVRDAQKVSRKSRTPLIICDPSCGVGSFIAQFFRVWISSNVEQAGRVKLVGQDKVDRMARLAKLNMLLFGTRTAAIARGNSVLKGSDLDKYKGLCDIIVTNPPFGARFHTSELRSQGREDFPCLYDFIQSTDAFIDSELLFIDKYLSLLKPGGVAYVVVPDAVISASGLPSLVREYLGKQCTVLSITELPAVTFAQAGTRTKTCLLHFRKEPSSSSSRVFFSCVKSLGFEVSSRKGVPYKKHEGENELPAIGQAIMTKVNASNEDVLIIRDHPTCVSRKHGSLMDSPWTPSHHSAERYSTLAELEKKTNKSGATLKKLREIVTLPNKKKRGVGYGVASRCISVLHVGDFGALNVRELMAYSPKYPGQSCSPGDILFSKINPRIPRVIVVPDLGFPMTCSSEFEVMRPIEPYSAYEVMLHLLSAHTQSQVQSLTSGTSSSHNRIKTEQLLDVLIRVPGGRPKHGGTYLQIIKSFEDAHISSIKAGILLNENWVKMNNFLRHK